MAWQGFAASAERPLDPGHDEEAWKKRFAEKREVIRRMAREALEEDERGETLPLDDLL